MTWENLLEYKCPNCGTELYQQRDSAPAICEACEFEVEGYQFMLLRKGIVKGMHKPAYKPQFGDSAEIYSILQGDGKEYLPVNE